MITKIIKDQNNNITIENRQALIALMNENVGKQIEVSVITDEKAHFEACINKLMTQVERWRDTPFDSTDITSIVDIRKKLSIESVYFSKHVNRLCFNLLSIQRDIKKAKYSILLREKAKDADVKVTNSTALASKEIEEMGLNEDELLAEAAYKYACNVQKDISNVQNAIASQLNALGKERTLSPIM